MDNDTIHIHPPLFAALCLITTLTLQYMLPSLRLFHSPHHVMGPLLVMAGLATMLPAATIFSSRGTTKNPYGEPATFVSSPPYTFTRNPMYLGIVLILGGLAVWAGSAVMLLAPLAFYLTIDRLVIPSEERTMERLFGDEYVQYKARVRRWL
jgi:protein-S-isoprenylcysteine O-methyltransferase Ste14